MKKTWGAWIAATATVAALVIATAAPASAAEAGDPTVGPGSSLAEIQRAGAAATDKRIDSLSEAIARVDANEKLTDADRDTIIATLNSDLAAMRDLAAEIAGDDTVSEAAADYRSIFTDYRVYAVVLPQALYAAGADALTGFALPKLQAAYDKLSAALEGSHADQSTPELQATLAHMAEMIADAEAGSATLAADALAVTPADWNADHTVLADIRLQLHDAVADARDASRDAREIAEAIR